MVKASDLIKEQTERDKKKNIIYKKIYKRIEVKVQQASLANLYECWYEIPEFILNLPLYNLEDCKIYIINKLKKNGFKTGEYINNIWISWKT
jgi:hypothetical protein